MYINLENVDKIKKANIELKGITIILTSKDAPKNLIGNVIFSSDVLLGRYINKLYEHRAFEIVEMCAQNASIESLSNINKLYLFNKIDRELKKKARLYNTLEEEIREILDIFETVLKQKSSIAKQIDIETYLGKINQLLHNKLQQSFIEIVKTKIKTEFLPKVSFEASDIKIEIIEDNEVKKFTQKNYQCTELKVLNKSNAVMNMESLGICDILADGYRKDFNYSEKKLYKRVLEVCFVSNGNSVSLINDVSDRDNLEVYGIDKNVINNFYDILDKVVDSIKKTSDNKYYLVYKYLNKKINLTDAPRDLRCFVDFKILLERYFFCGHKWAKPKIIVFKEPESYLNDTWQDLYAEFVVLLQKYIIPNLIIRTENKDLMAKIEYYIKIHDSIVKVNLYEAVAKNDGFNLNELID
ncbi:MAG: hypothetical protein IAA85_03215 [Firmicutes bacterium]|nr:hypothetical protein [Candidatus Alectryobacillus merdavium]